MTEAVEATSNCFNNYNIYGPLDNGISMVTRRRPVYGRQSQIMIAADSLFSKDATTPLRAAVACPFVFLPVRLSVRLTVPVSLPPFVVVICRRVTTAHELMCDQPEAASRRPARRFSREIYFEFKWFYANLHHFAYSCGLVRFCVYICVLQSFAQVIL